MKRLPLPSSALRLLRSLAAALCVGRSSVLCLLSSVSALAAEPNPDLFAYDKSAPLNVQEATYDAGHDLNKLEVVTNRLAWLFRELELK